jgi:hypothetical protein
MVSFHSSISNAFVCKLFGGGYIHGIPIEGSADDKLPSVMTTADYNASTHDFMDDIVPP